jgi:hypothetical protein
MTAKEEIKLRQDYYQRKRGDLAVERLALSRKIEEIDKMLAACETAIEVNTMTLKDIDTQAAIDAAKEKSECQSS